MSASGEERVVRSYCRGCHGGCGVLVHVNEGRVTKIEGDPDFPTNRGSLCSKGLAAAQLVYHPDRVTRPLKRAGSKGSGKWEPITWDEALETISSKLKQVKSGYGAESIAFGYGTGRNYEHWLYRFANLLGSPNVLTAGHMCYGPRLASTAVTCGKLPVADYDNNPECVMVWGNNIVWTNPDEYLSAGFIRALNKGARLIVVDPRLTYLAGRADIWLQLRPGTDTALAFAMANVMINENLYDTEFISKYAHGWDSFVKRASEYTPEKVAEITSVPAETIKSAARLYARSKPSCIQWGVAIEQNVNSIDNNRILTILMAMTGNIDVPGGNVFHVPPKIRTISEFSGHQLLPKEQANKRLGGETYRLANRIAVLTPKAVWDAISTGKPYPVKAMMLHGTNPVITRANAKEVYQALKSVEFLSVADFFLTPTAELADIFLPAAHWLEFDDIGDYLFRHGYVSARKKVVQIDDCWSDHRIFNQLGKRMGQEQYWAKEEEGDLDYILEPSGLTWKQFSEKGYLQGEMEYRKHEKRGFSTPTRKFEVHSTIIEDMGYDPLPGYHEAPESPVSKPDMLEEYPYILVTGARIPVFFHSEYRMIPWLREIHPDPIIEIHPETAARHGIKNGDWVTIESPRGKVEQRARLTTVVKPGLVAAQHGWWFPEVKDAGHGWDVSNINIITDNDPSGYDPMMGATNLRTLLCKIYPSEKR